MTDLYLLLATILQENDEIRIKRFSLSKVNEVFYESEKNLLEDFKEEIIGLNYYGKTVDWLHPKTQMSQTLNFESDNFFVNITKLIDNGAIEKDVLIRLLLQFEVFLTNEPDISPQALLNDMNKKMNQLFFESLSEKGFQKIKENQLGDCHYD